MGKTIVSTKYYSEQKSFNEGDFVFCDYYFGYYKLIKFVDSYDSYYYDDDGNFRVSKTKQWVLKKLLTKNNKISILVREIPDWLLRKVTKDEMLVINKTLQDPKILKKFEETENETSFSFCSDICKYNLTKKMC